MNGEGHIMTTLYTYLCTCEDGSVEEINSTRDNSEDFVEAMNDPYFREVRIHDGRHGKVIDRAVMLSSRDI